MASSTHNSKNQVPGGSTLTAQNETTGRNIEALLDLNALSYDLVPDLSVAIDRTNKNSYFQKAEYRDGASNTGYCISNSGSDYINPRTSYLAFELGCVQPVVETTLANADAFIMAKWSNNGSACNLIRNIRISDRAGNEIEYVTDCNIIGAINRRLMKSPDWFNSTHKLATHESLTKQATGTLPATALSAWAGDDNKQIDINDTYAYDNSSSNGQKRFIIPLRWISGLFDYSQLLPPALMSGLRIQIEWETSERAFQYYKGSATGTPLTTVDNNSRWKVINPRIVMDSVKLTDSIARQLNKRSATDGLEIQFRTWFTSHYYTAGNTANIETRRAVSRAFGALAHVQKAVTSTGDEISRDSISTDPIDVVEWQWRAGNLYFPQQPIKVNSSTGNGTAVSAARQAILKRLQMGRETYAQMLQYSGKLENPVDVGSLTVGDYTMSANTVDTSTTVKQDHGGMSIIPCNLERSSVQDVSGLPLNNSRVLALNMTFDSASATDARDIRIFLQYLKIARVFMDNTELEE